MVALCFHLAFEKHSSQITGVEEQNQNNLLIKTILYFVGGGRAERMIEFKLIDLAFAARAEHVPTSSLQLPL